jgi:hypothetical protein
MGRAFLAVQRDRQDGVRSYDFACDISLKPRQVKYLRAAAYLCPLYCLQRNETGDIRVVEGIKTTSRVEAAIRVIEEWNAGRVMKSATGRLVSSTPAIQRMPRPSKTLELAVLYGIGAQSGRFSALAPTISNVPRPYPVWARSAVEEDQVKLDVSLGKEFMLDVLEAQKRATGALGVPAKVLFPAKIQTEAQAMIAGTGIPDSGLFPNWWLKPQPHPHDQVDVTTEASTPQYVPSKTDRKGRLVKITFAGRESLLSKEQQRFRIASDLLVSAMGKYACYWQCDYMLQPTIAKPLPPPTQRFTSVWQGESVAKPVGEIDRTLERVRLAKRYAALEHLAYLEGWYPSWTASALQIHERTGNVLATVCRRAGEESLDPIHRRLIEAGTVYRAFHFLGGTEEQLDNLAKTYE